MNIAVLFDANAEQQAALIKLMAAQKINDWLKKFDLDLAEECWLEEEDIKEYGWDKVCKTSYEMAFVRQDGSSINPKEVKVADLKPEDFSFYKFELNNIALVYENSFDQMIKSVWSRAFEDCEIEDYAILCFEDSTCDLGEEPKFSISVQSSGALEDQVFIGAISGCQDGKYLKINQGMGCEPRFWEGNASEKAEGCYSIMTLESARKYWCQLTNNDLSEVEQLSVENFLTLVNYYDYSSIVDKVAPELLTNEQKLNSTNDGCSRNLLNFISTDGYTQSLSELDEKESLRLDYGFHLNVDCFSKNNVQAFFS